MKHLILISILMTYGYALNAQHLKAYQQKAVDSNPSLKAKYKMVEVSLQRAIQAGGFPDPNFSFSFSIMSDGDHTSILPARLSLSQMFPWFGTLKAQKNEAALRAEADYFSYLDLKNQIFFQVAEAYFPIWELKKIMDIEKENIAILQSYKSIALKKFESGIGTMVDVLRVDIMLKQSETNLSILAKKESPLSTTFYSLLGSKKHFPIQIDEAFFYGMKNAVVLEDSFFNQHPKILELKKKIQSTDAMKKVAIRRGLPNFGLGVDYVMAGSLGVMGVPTQADNMFMPMMSMSIPIFRKKYKAALKEAELMKEVYTLEKQNTENLLKSKVDVLQFEIQQQEELLSLYEQQILSAKQSLNLLLTAYSNSSKGFEDILLMQQELLSYQKLRVESTTLYHIKWAELNYITSKNN